MNKLTPTQVEQLIQLVKENPAIYDKGNRFYKYASLKDKVWLDISKTVGVEENDCKMAWKSLRDQFTKAVKDEKGKSGQEATERKQYKYYHQLLFLRETIQTRKRTSNYDQLVEECETLLKNPDIFDIIEENTEDTNFDQNNSQQFSPSPGPSKRSKKSSTDDDNLSEFLDGIMTEIKSSNVPDDNQTFFSSIANMVRNANINPLQTRQLHRKVFNFVSEELDQIECTIMQ